MNEDLEIKLNELKLRESIFFNKFRKYPEGYSIMAKYETVEEIEIAIELLKVEKEKLDKAEAKKAKKNKRR